MKIVRGEALEITLPNGKRFYTGINSINHHTCSDAGLACRVVSYEGCCIYANINDRAHSRFPVSINGVDITKQLETVATDAEFHSFMKGR